MQRFLGSIQYIARFIPDLQLHLLPITPLLNKNTPFFWGKKQQDAFNKIKSLISTDPHLNYVNANLPLYLYADASQHAGGSVLFQETDDHQKRPIAYFSRKFSPIQSQLYSSLELELLNVIDSIGRVKNFTDLNRHPLHVVTDAKNILFLLRSQEIGPNPKLSRLAARLANLDIKYRISYEKPDNNPPFLIADFISRSFDPTTPELKPVPISHLRKFLFFQQEIFAGTGIGY